MRNAIIIALTATFAGVLFDRYLRKRELLSETAPAARKSPEVAQLDRSGSPDRVMNADYWSGFGQEIRIGEGAPSSQLSANAFSGYAALGRSPVVQ